MFGVMCAYAWAGVKLAKIFAISVTTSRFILFLFCSCFVCVRVCACVCMCVSVCVCVLLRFVCLFVCFLFCYLSEDKNTGERDEEIMHIGIASAEITSLTFQIVLLMAARWRDQSNL